MRIRLGVLSLVLCVAVSSALAQTLSPEHQATVKAMAGRLHAPPSIAISTRPFTWADIAIFRTPSGQRSRRGSRRGWTQRGSGENSEPTRTGTSLAFSSCLHGEIARCATTECRVSTDYDYDY